MRSRANMWEYITYSIHLNIINKLLISLSQGSNPSIKGSWIFATRTEYLAMKTPSAMF